MNTPSGSPLTKTSAPVIAVISEADVVSRMPRRIPRALRHHLARWVLHALALDHINALYARCQVCHGGAFAAAVLDDLHIRIELTVEPRAALMLGRYRAERRPFVVVANHPFGALDGIALLAWLSPLFPDFKLMANNILQRVEALHQSLFTVEPIGVATTATHNLTALHRAYRHVTDGGSLGMFPTGHVMTLSELLRPRRAVPWPQQVQKMLRHLDVPILPIHIEGRNTVPFYLLGLLGWRVRSLRLPREVFRKRGATLRIHVGDFTTTSAVSESPDTSSRP